MDFSKHAAIVRERLADLERRISDPTVLSNPRDLADLTRQHRRMQELANAFSRRESAETRRDEASSLLNESDPEMAELAREEMEQAEADLEKLDREIRLLLIPPDPHDDRNTILEIRAGTGGEEAALFAGDLARMYQRYCEERGWRMTMLSSTPSDLGGFREAIFNIEGQGVYRRLKFESGTHRVQRVPVTETQGRIHTSAVTVAVLPEADEVDIQIKKDDLKIETFRSTGPGGQSVNTTDSAVRITHLPTGLVVSCQDEKSQIKNNAKAMKVLRARLLEQEQRKLDKERAAERSKMVGTGDRSQRIRTYNFPENRVTDHRVNYRSKNLDHILQGQIENMIESLIAAEQEERLAASAEID